MRRCPICRLAYRANDPGGTCFVPRENKHGASSGSYSACSECCAVYEPSGPWARYCSTILAAPDPYSVRSSTIQAPGGVSDQAPPGLCGLCRRFAREDDSMDALRLWREDLTAEEQERLIPPQDQHACYAACGECRRKWAPVILARLQAQGRAPEGMTPNQMAATMFA